MVLCDAVVVFHSATDMQMIRYSPCWNLNADLSLSNLSTSIFQYPHSVSKDCVFSKRFNAFIHLWNRVRFPLRYGVKLPVTNAELEESVFLGRKYNWRDLFYLCKFNYFMFQHFVYFCFLKFPRLGACPVEGGVDRFCVVVHWFDAVLDCGDTT